MAPIAYTDERFLVRVRREEGKSLSKSKRENKIISGTYCPERGTSGRDYVRT